MRKHTITISVYLIIMISLLLTSDIVQAQSNTDSHQISISISEIAIIDVFNDDTLTFTVLPPLLPGNPPRINPQIDFSKRLFYTSIIPSLGITRRVTVKLNPDLPDGISIRLLALPPFGGTGNCGQSVMEFVDLSITEQDILYNIESCWTGRTNGSILIYSAGIDPASFDGIYAQNKTVSVIYTLTDN